jgi:hypothetical protein
MGKTNDYNPLPLPQQRLKNQQSGYANNDRQQHIFCAPGYQYRHDPG